MDVKSDNKDEDRCERFAHKVLLMIDNAFKDACFNYDFDKGHCAKHYPLTPAICCDDMSEADILRWTQQKIIKKFINMHFGDKIIVSEKKSLSENEEAIKHAKHMF